MTNLKQARKKTSFPINLLYLDQGSRLEHLATILAKARDILRYGRQIPNGDEEKEARSWPSCYEQGIISQSQTTKYRLKSSPTTTAESQHSAANRGINGELIDVARSSTNSGREAQNRGHEELRVKMLCSTRFSQVHSGKADEVSSYWSWHARRFHLQESDV